MLSHSFDTVTVDQAPVTRDQRSDLRMFTSGDAGFLFCLFLFKDDLEAFYFFLDDRREDEQGDQVRDRHESIGNIGKVPHQIEGLGSAYINDQEKTMR